MPDIVEFVTGPAYLNMKKVYPRQFTMLKLMTLSTESLTEFDHGVIDEWAHGFELVQDDRGARYEGRRGIVPDVLARVERCRSEGRRWFRDAELVIGRRGSKGRLTAIMLAYQLFFYLTHTSPQSLIGVDENKTLSVVIFGGNKDQAKSNVFRDVVAVLGDAPCFQPYLIEPTSDEIRLYSHAQLLEGDVPKSQAAFEIIAAETTPRAIRGRATIAVVLDEAAHIVASGANRSAEEIWIAARPALSQCGPQGKWALAIQASSPWSQTGQFYQSYLQGLAVDPATRDSVAYDTFVAQLPSWSPYEGFEATQHDLPMKPGGPNFVPIDSPIIAYDERLQRDRDEDPEVFDTEYGAQWATSSDHYLPADAVEAMFGPYLGEPLVPAEGGILSRTYCAHADPSAVGDNFALAVGHSEPSDGPIPHVVFDLLHCWHPNDFPDHTIDYLQIADELGAVLDRFGTIESLTFDQFNSVWLVQQLQASADKARRPVRANIYATATTRASNIERSEHFKKLLLMGHLHAPRHELARQELLFLRRNGDRIEAPTFGSVTTDDMVDCMVEVAYRLVSPDSLVNQRLAAGGLHAALQGGTRPGPFGTPSPRDQAVFDAMSASGRRTQWHSEPRGAFRVPGRPKW
jgi:hypothetical protein